jgi:tripeptide aminopeptidase
MEKVVERFLKYIKYDTRSDEESNTVPTTKNQLILANDLAKELKALGLSDVSIDSNGYVMATLDANTDKNIPVIGFIAHMDTSPEMSGKDVNPNIIKDYDGLDIILNRDKNIVLNVKEFPELKNYIGEDLIVTDGTTLLGADDKAGIAEIITAMEYLIQHPEIKHGAIKVGFTPDEEVGRGANYFDVDKFNADFAYTLDGGTVGEIECENFNAASAKVCIRGKNIHPGSAKNKMINSILVANEFINMLPKNEVPEATSGYEGFYHLNSIKGEVEDTILHYIIRDFYKENFEKRKQLMIDIEKFINSKYERNVVSVEIKDSYYNMREKLEDCMHIVNTAIEAIEETGVKPLIRPIRGGTDGARLSFMGLPTPNIFTGGENFHGKFEYIPIYAMNKAVEVIINIIKLYSEK